MRPILVLLACASPFALAACVTEKAAKDPYAATIYTGAGQIDGPDIYAALYAPDVASANGTPFEVASYVGIDGARRAHELYTEEEAEKLDGRCERFVEASATESLMDIASLCDVSLETLVAYNPDIREVSYSVVEIPGGFVQPAGTFAMSGALAELYSLQDGDSLDKIAYKLGVSPADIANLNPNVDWTEKPSPGMLIRTPITSASAASDAYAPPAGWEGWSGHGLNGSGAARAVDPTALAPYTLGPVKSYARAVGIYPDDQLEVDRKFVKYGGTVEVTAKAAPGSEVEFFVGDDPADMQRAGRARADESGRATARIKVPRDEDSDFQPDAGGVIFKAKPRDGATQFSERVGVVTLREEVPPKQEKPAKDPDADEDEDE